MRKITLNSGQTLDINKKQERHLKQKGYLLIGDPDDLDVEPILIINNLAHITLDENKQSAGLHILFNQGALLNEIIFMNTSKKEIHAAISTGNFTTEHIHHWNFHARNEMDRDTWERNSNLPFETLDIAA